MSKSMELKQTNAIVRHILGTQPKARNSDDYLYVKVCEYINPGYITLPFGEVILNRKDFHFPAFESVRRTRQKLQADHPELYAADADVEAQRDLNEDTFRQYSLM